MYVLKKLNVIKIADDDLKKNELLKQGFEIVCQNKKTKLKQNSEKR